MSLDEIKQKGFWAGELRYNRVPEGLPTPSGKIEIHAQSFADAGQNPYPVYMDRSVIPDSDYPLQLTHSKLSAHCNIVTQNNPYLMEICGENWVEINRRDAVKYGVQDDTYVNRRITQGQHSHQGQGGRGTGPGMRERAPWSRVRPLGHGRRRPGARVRIRTT